MDKLEILTNRIHALGGHVESLRGDIKLALNLNSF